LISNHLHQLCGRL